VCPPVRLEKSDVLVELWALWPILLFGAALDANFGSQGIWRRWRVDGLKAKERSEPTKHDWIGFLYGDSKVKKRRVIYVSQVKTSQEHVADVQEGNYQVVDPVSAKLTN